MYGFTSSMTVPSESSILVTADLERRKRRMRVHQKAMKVVMGPLQDCELKGVSSKN